MKREEALLERFPQGVKPLETPYDIPQYSVEPDVLFEVARFLKESGFNMLLDVGGVDYLPRSPRFEVVYHLLNMTTSERVRLRATPADDNPEVPSIAALWPSAAPAEREVYDLFGVRFSGHPNLKRILMPDDWEGHPLRKDYPLTGPRAERIRFAADKNRYHAPKLGGER